MELNWYCFCIKLLSSRSMLQLRRVSATANSRRRFWGVLDFASGVLVVDFHYFQYFDATSSTKSSRATRQMTWTERSTTTTAPAPATATSSAASRSIGRPVRVLLRKENLTFFGLVCVFDDARKWRRLCTASSSTRPTASCLRDCDPCGVLDRVSFSIVHVLH